MDKRRLIILTSILFLCFPIYTFAETIVLKSGQTVEGKLIEKTDKYIKINFQGVPLTYYFDEIKSIEEQGQSVSDSASAVASNPQPQGQLEAIVIVSASPDFIKEWMGANYSHAPHIQRLEEIERNQTFYSAIIVSGYGVDDKGKIGLTGDFVLLEPDGKVALQKKGIFKIKVEKGGSPGAFLIMDPTLDLVLEDSDPLGIYTIRAIVKDNILNKTVTGDYKVTLKEKTKKAPSVSGFYSDQEFSKWMTYYYVQPEPEKIPSAVKYYSDSSIFNKVNSRLPMNAFFAAIFRNNSELMKKTFEDISTDGSKNLKIFFLRTLWLVNNGESKELINKASLNWKSDEINKQIQDVLTSVPPDIFNDTIKDAAQLDMLWATFLATGDSVPVKKIISVLRLLKEGHGIEIVIGGAARWSLTSNAIQHRKVYQICQEELKNTDGETKSLLQEIISKAYEKN